MISFTEIKRFADIVWHTGNFLGRIFISFLVLFPIALAVVSAMGGGTTITSLVALAPFLALAAGLCIYPVIIAAMIAIDEKFGIGHGKNILKWIFAVIGVELVIGVYFSAVPLSNDKGLVPFLVLVIASIITLSLAKNLKSIRLALWILLFVLTVVFIKGGRNELGKKTSPPPQKQSFQQQRSYMENGLIIKRECTVDNIVPKRETPTYIKTVPGLPIINMVTNCRNDDMITRLEPGEEIDARHRDFGPLREKENRCSYNYCGDSVPVGGEVGAVTRARFVTDLAFPQFPFGVVVFYIIDDDGKLVDSGYIPHPGGIVHLINKSGKKATLFSRYNIMKTYFEDKNYKIQVGWDGSTIAHEIVRQHPNIPTRQ